MIQIVRTYNARSIPPAFRGAKRVAKQRLLLDRLRGGTKPKELEFKASVWKPAKPALKRETGGKCAYCEAPAGGRSKGTGEKGGLVAHCDVEHFRPKNLYWWLAHSFENYNYSCQICNQSFKSDKFPVAIRLTAPFAVLGTETDAQLDALADVMAPDPLDSVKRAAWEGVILAEDADLSDPIHEDPELLFKYVADETLKEVAMAASAGAGRRKVRAEATIEVIGLNREELRFARYDLYQTVHVLKKVLDDPGILPETRTMVTTELSRLMCANQPFAGMVRYFVRKVWQLPIV